MADFRTQEAGDATPRAFTLVKRSDSSPIIAGTVSYFLNCVAGSQAGKWWRDSDSTWQVAETANVMSHVSDGHWVRTLAASPWVDGDTDLEYAKESGDLHVPTARLLKVEYTPSADSSRRVDLGLWLGDAPAPLLHQRVDARFEVARSGTAQAGGADYITLDAGASALDNFYALGYWVVIPTGTGALQGRMVTAYNGTTKKMSVYPNWAVAPDNTSTFEVHITPQVAVGSSSVNAVVVTGGTSSSSGSPGTFFLKKGNLAPSLRDVITRDGVAVDLTGATVTFKMRLNGAPSGGVSGAATVIDAAGGVVQYDWAAGNTDIVGFYLIEWECVLPGSIPLTAPGYGFVWVRIVAGLA